MRLASQLFPELVAALTALAGGGDGDADGARGWILDWAAAHWRPEDGLPEPESWRRLAAPLWDETADTVALDLVRTRSDEQRAGQCGMKSPRATAESCGRPRTPTTARASLSTPKKSAQSADDLLSTDYAEYAD